MSHNFFDNAHTLAFHGGEKEVPAFSEVLHEILREVETKDNEGWHEAVRSLRMGTVCDIPSPKSLTRPVVRLSKQGQNSTDRHVHGGQVERLKQGLLKAGRY